MLVTQIREHARMLYQAHGDKAEFEAAQKARAFEESGDEAQAREWRAIREAIHEMRGPHAS